MLSRRVYVLIFGIYMMLMAVMIAAMSWIRQGPVFQITPANADSTIQLKARVNPNPARESLVLSLPLGALEKRPEYALVDQQGRILRSGWITGTNTTIDLSGMKNGAYYIKIITLKKEVAGFKVLKLK